MPELQDLRGTYQHSLAFVLRREEIPWILNARRLTGLGVEVGVQYGLFSEHLLRYWAGTRLYSVDPWAAQPASYVDIANVDADEQERRYQQTRARLAPFGPRSVIVRDYSVDAAATLPDACLDFVYLDGRHDRAGITEDLIAWWPKVRPGGLFAGHDFVPDGTYSAGVFGVQGAVLDFCAARGVRVHATLQDEPCYSWLVEKPQPPLPAVDAGTTTGA